MLKIDEVVLADAYTIYKTLVSSHSLSYTIFHRNALNITLSPHPILVQNVIVFIELTKTEALPNISQ